MITSKNNATIKYAQKLKEKKYSRLEKKCLVESVKLVRELYDNGLVDTILVDSEKLNKVSNLKNAKIETITSEIAISLSDAMTSDGVLAICNIPQKVDADFEKCIILDNIQDPSNLGAIIRSAKAFGFDTILALNCVYPYTFKGIRSSMGQIFGINYLDISYDELQSIKNYNNLEFIVADMGGKNIDGFQPTHEKIAIIIGNEGNGVSTELRELADSIISIPMKEGVESLNASVSAGIIMYLLR